MLKQRIHEILGETVPGDQVGYFFDLFIIVLILLNVLAITLETVASINASYAGFFTYFEIFSVIIFTLEYLLRVWSCTEEIKDDYSQPIMGRIKFMATPMAVIDLISFLPFYLTPFFAIDLRLLRILRLLRLLKLVHYSPALTVIWVVITKQRHALTAAFFIMLVALVFTSSIIWIFEHEAQPEKFSSIPESMWWSLATLTTVGYGDVTPITNGGKIFAGLTMIIAIGLAALPIGVIATGFADEIQKHEFMITWRLLAKVPLFSDLHAEQIAFIGEMLTPLRVPPKHTVITNGTEADCMFFIISGEVEVKLNSQLIKLKAGDFFGETGIIKNSVRMADVISVTECQLVELSKHKFSELITLHPEIGEHVHGIMERRMRDNVDTTV
jgi:voltage-gated potassium channel